jgi:hypothetical protein
MHRFCALLALRCPGVSARYNLQVSTGENTRGETDGNILRGAVCLASSYQVSIQYPSLPMSKA